MSEPGTMTAPEELAALREEVAGLRRQLERVLDVLGLHEWPGEPRVEYVSVEAESVAVRRDRFHVPIIARAEEEGAFISLMGEGNACRAEWKVDKEGARLEFRNAKHEVVVSIGEGPEGGGMIYVAAPDGTPRAGMRAAQEAGVVNVVNAKGEPLAFLRGDPAGGQVFVLSATGQPAVKLAADPMGGLITVFEPGGQVMGFLFATSDHGNLTIYGPHGAMAASLASDANGGTVLFYDIEGNTKTSLP